MEIQDIYHKLEKQCPAGYRINEIIPFSYPLKHLRIKATVNKSPEESVSQVYSVLLRTISEGYSTEAQITQFLGLQNNDFMLKELYFLKERGFANVISGNWVPTALGNQFIKDHSILKVLEEEEFDFMFDGYTSELLARITRSTNRKKMQKHLTPQIDYPHKSPQMLEGKHEQLTGIYNNQDKGKAQLVDYDKNHLLFDKDEFAHYYLIEYIPHRSPENELEPYIQIRNSDEAISLENRLTARLSQEYPAILYQFSDSERSVVAQLKEKSPNNPITEWQEEVIEIPTATETLSVWATQAKFKEALSTAKKKILIESPWIKKATLMYLSLLENALKRGVRIIILYGIQNNDEHDMGVMEKLSALQSDYRSTFQLIHLPAHFEHSRPYDLTGTHRKLVIKDDDYYIQGSFNFLSFNKKEGQRIANEESILIRNQVEEKWTQVFEDYDLIPKIL